MSPDTIEHVLVGLAAVWTAMFTGFLAVLKWQSNRDAERAREREHELKLANKAIEEQKARSEASAQDRIDSLKDEVLSIRQTVEKRLFQVIDESHERARAIEAALDCCNEEIQRAGDTQLAHFTTNLATLEDNIVSRISGEYTQILELVGSLIEHTSKFEVNVEELVNQIASHHDNVMLAIQAIGASDVTD